MQGVHKFYDSSMGEKRHAQLRAAIARNQKQWPLVVNIFLPCVVFSALLWILSSAVRYQTPHLLGAILIAVCTVVLVSMWFCIFFLRRHVGLAILLTFAILGGCVCGEVNYKYNMHPVYTMQSMRERTGINPAETPGAAVADTGRAYFTKDSYVDVDKGMSYQTMDTYCVAPISVGDGKLGSYDYWAVGINCCSSADPNFQLCARTQGPARAGIRLMFPEQAQYFKLAVEQAESEYNIRSSETPLFFYWVDDPLQELRNYETAGFQAKVGYSFAYMPANLVLAVCFTFMLP